MYLTTASAASGLLDAIGGLVDAVGGPLKGLLVAVVLMVVGFACSVLVGVAVNDAWQATPRLTRWLLRWSARHRYGDTERVATRAEEQAAGLEATGIHLYGLVIALRFAGAAIAWRCWARVRAPIARKRIQVTSTVLTPVPAGQHGDVDLPPTDIAGPDVGDTARRAGRFRVVVTGVRIAGKALIGSGLVLGVLCATAAIAALGSTVGADLDLGYDSGDEPQSETAPSGCVRSACPPGPSSDNWDLASGSSIETTYTSRSADVDTLSGELQLFDPSCTAARVAWRITADGATLAEGTLNEGNSQDVEAVAVPTRRAAESVTIAARRLDDHSCAADLSWTEPGYETPGPFPPL